LSFQIDCRKGIAQASARLYHVSHQRRNEAVKALESSVAATPLAKDLAQVNKQIQRELDCCRISELRSASGYYFDFKGKHIRPTIALLMSYACNETGDSKNISYEQQTIAVISEMIHNSTLVHDDVIDLATTRRGQPVLHHTWGYKNAVFVGIFIMACSSVCLSKVNNPEVVELMTMILGNLVKGKCSFCSSCVSNLR
jgi:geranylgeranyl pyrophosphate synthase